MCTIREHNLYVLSKVVTCFYHPLNTTHAYIHVHNGTVLPSSDLGFTSQNIELSQQRCPSPLEMRSSLFICHVTVILQLCTGTFVSLHTAYSWMAAVTVR